MDKICECCGEEFYAEEEGKACDDCREQVELFSGDYNLLHPDETEEEFDDHNP